LDVREKDILEMNERLALPEKSLDYPPDENYRYPMRDLISSRDVPVDQQLANQEAKEIFRDKLKEFHKTLQGKERDIFENRLMAENPETLQTIGNRYGIVPGIIGYRPRSSPGYYHIYPHQSFPGLGIGYCTLDNDLLVSSP